MGVGEVADWLALAPVGGRPHRPTRYSPVANAPLIAEKWHLVNTPSSRGPWRRLLWALLSLPSFSSVAGCRSQDVTCGDGIPGCGGDPSGTWNVVNACRDPVFLAPYQPTYSGQPVATARQPNPPLASSDWCASLVLGESGITAFTFPHQTLSVSPATQLVYTRDGQAQGTYQATIATDGPGQIDLSTTCLTRLGATLSCDQVTSALQSFAAMRPADPGTPCSDGPDQPGTCQFYFSYSNIACVGLLAGGCRCRYDISFSATLTGRWQSVGTTLVHSSNRKMLPSEADYCVAGNGQSLSLRGHEQTSLFNQPGIRSLELQKAP